MLTIPTLAVFQGSCIIHTLLNKILRSSRKQVISLKTKHATIKQHHNCTSWHLSKKKWKFMPSKIHTWMFIVAQSWKQPWYSSTGELTFIYLFHGIILSNKNKSSIRATTSMDLHSLVLGKQNQSQKLICYIILFLWHCFLIFWYWGLNSGTHTC
jgi:hypothetical protein